MDLADLRLWYRYNTWAMHRVLDACEPLSAEQFNRDLKNSFPSVRATLAHMFGAESVWQARFEGESPRGFPTDAMTSVGHFRDGWSALQARQQAHLDSVDAARLDTILAYTNIQGEPKRFLLGHAMRHVVNHATYHRGQVVTMLRQLGAAGVSTDFVQFLEEPESAG